MTPGDINTEEKEIQIFSNTEISKLETALQKHKLKNLLLLALGTGLRQ